MLISLTTERFIWRTYRELQRPFYLSDQQVLKEQWNMFTGTAPSGTVVHYAAMANDDPSIIRWFEKQECRIFVGSWDHLRLVQDMGFPSNRIVAGLTSLTETQLADLLERVHAVIIGSEIELDMASFLPGKANLLIRVNIAEPKKRLRGGLRTMGLPPDLVTEHWRSWLSRDPRLAGIHSYAGTNILNLRLLAQRAKKAMRLGSGLPGLKVIDIGGGFPAPAKKAICEEDLDAFWSVAASDLRRDIELWVEPGRFMVAPTSVFVTAVTEVELRSGQRCVGTDASVLMFPRRLLFGAPDKDHPLVVLSPSRHAVSRIWKDVLVMGNTTFSRDVLYKGSMPQVKPKDLLVFSNAGAYCRTAIPRFLGTIVPPQVLVPNLKESVNAMTEIVQVRPNVDLDRSAGTARLT